MACTKTPNELREQDSADADAVIDAYNRVKYGLATSPSRSSRRRGDMSKEDSKKSRLHETCSRDFIIS